MSEHMVQVRIFLETLFSQGDELKKIFFFLFTEIYSQG